MALRHAGARDARHAAASRDTVAAYTLNALGQRVRKVAGSADIDYVYDLNGHLIGEYANGTLLREYVYVDDLPIAQIESGGALTYLHPDHLGTPRTGTDGNAQIVWRWDGDPFGEAGPNEGPDGDMNTVTVNLRFPGQYFDVETGLNYNYFRDCDPTTGRSTQSDPIGLAGGLNTYLYANANPLVYIDPTGEFAFALPAIPPALAALGKAAAFVGSAALAGYALSEVSDDRRKRGRGDPIAGEQPCNPGRDCDGRCNPCKETVCWQATHKGAPQWHWIELNQNLVTCECFPKRGEGTSPPAGCRRIR